MKKRIVIALLACACLGGTTLRAEGSGAMYLLAGVDGKLLSNQDANNYFNLNSQLGPQGYPGAVVHLGYQLGRFLALEASASFGPIRENEVAYDNGILGVTRLVKTRWALTTYSLTPALTVAGSGWVSLLGLRVGLAGLTGHVDDTAWGLNGTYDQEAQAVDLGVVLRHSVIVANHFSLGLELGYDLTVFKDIKNTNGTGTYATPHSPERNISAIAHNGDQTTLDFSGPHLALVVGLWSQAPVREE